ncbi:pyruvate ferredoxin oxidoreductase [Archaeoglobus veneficus]|uniref:Pyruvate synthase n=1 Tax=Archaeoglobus veneficus (strain DSM 11195 / SNP6) TaxID=693661 RepID=F2KPL9_ARCVS|nr:pyruvate ferredoxin oxidoreductase [Archaeoglobus veneficus]AEA47547.1 Pyruvate synthase [Archaeoglobus veneficus SNP6]
MRTLLTGNYAVAEAVKLSRAKVIAAYPITPQTTIVEKLAEMVEKGELDAEFIRVESEHSALAAVYGAAAAGLRTFTATSSHGLLYLYEMVWWVANARLPLVMAVVTRTIGPPWNIHTDHTDLLTMRDSGWIISMAENVQEAFDLTIQGFRISEEAELPFVVGMDAFQLSHTAEVIDLPSQEDVDKWLPERKQSYKIEPNNPVTVGSIGPNEYTAKLRYDMAKTIESSKELIRKADESFGKTFGRSYGGLVESYELDDAEYVVVMAGAWCGDAKDAIDRLRAEGLPVGMLRLRYFRPFPREELEELEGRKVLVVDRAFSMGHMGILGMEVSSVINNVTNVIAGIGGVDVGVEDFEAMFRRFAKGELQRVEWWPKEVFS